MNGHSSYAPGGLGASTLAGNVISSDRVDVRIIGRHPKTGTPPTGVPFSLDIEVKTYQGFIQTLWEAPITGWVTCPDAIVAVRSADSGRVWGSQRMRTSMWDNCRAQARLVFHRDFIPDEVHRVVFEIYPEGVDTGELSKDDRIERSAIMTLDIGQSDGEQSGVYAPPTKSWHELPSINTGAGSALGEVNTLLKRVILVAGVGAGFYFLSPMLPGLRDGLKNMAPKPDRKPE